MHNFTTYIQTLFMLSFDIVQLHQLHVSLVLGQNTFTLRQVYRTASQPDERVDELRIDLQQ